MTIFCCLIPLGVLFTNRAFEELVLGLSWRGNPELDGVGGICQSRVRIKSDRNAYSFNALFISLKSLQEIRIPLRMGVLNLGRCKMQIFKIKVGFACMYVYLRGARYITDFNG